jgi:AcrR family transcriptional regulator
MSVPKIDSEDNLTVEVHETRKRLLDAAEETFARKGFDGTPVRDITDKAGCGVASINYVFGDKKKLYVELFKMLLREMRDTRLQGIKSALEKGKKLTLEELLRAYADAFLEPFSDSQRSERVIQLFSRELAEQLLPQNMFIDEMGPVIESMEEALMTVCPGLKKNDAKMGVISITGQLVHIMQVRMLFKRSRDKLNIDEAVDYIIKFSAGGIRACIRK